MSTVNEQLLSRPINFVRVIISEPVRGRLKHGKRLNVCHFLRRIRTAWEERHRYIVTGFLRRSFHGRATAEDDQVSERNALATAGCGVELLLDSFEGAKDTGQCCRVIRLPAALRLEPDASAVRAAALVSATVGRCRCLGGCHELRDREA